MSVFYTSFRESFHAHSRMDNELPFYTKKEVATHNTPEDLWVLVKGKVYDFTQFHHRHPGGPGVIAQNAGKDVTKTFQGAHGRDNPKKKHLIGRLAPQAGQAEKKASFMRKLFDWGKKSSDAGSPAKVKDGETAPFATAPSQEKASTLDEVEAQQIVVHGPNAQEDVTLTMVEEVEKEYV